VPSSITPYRLPSRRNIDWTRATSPVEPVTPGSCSIAAASVPPGPENTVTCAPFVASNVRSQERSATRSIPTAIVSAAAAADTTSTVRTACSARWRRPANARRTRTGVISHLQPQQLRDDG
jgi:hypothetical protein